MVGEFIFNNSGVSNFSLLTSHFKAVVLGSRVAENPGHMS